MCFQRATVQPGKKAGIKPALEISIWLVTHIIVTTKLWGSAILLFLVVPEHLLSTGPEHQKSSPTLLRQLRQLEEVERIWHRSGALKHTSC